MLFTYLLLAFAVITAINCLFYLLFLKFTFSKQKKINEIENPVSVIVYTKNQADILEHFLGKLVIQTHTNYELVIVNNASYDHTIDVLENFQKEHSSKKIEIVNVENNEAFWGSKKYAITLGIKKASYDNLLFITPEAEVISENWIAATTQNFNEDKQIFVGYQNFDKKGGFFSKLMRYNRFQSFLQNLGLGALTQPYFASEDNFGYTNSLFFENNGFSTHMSIPNGTENLFLKEASTGKNVALAINADNIILTKTPSFKEWIYKCKLHLQSFGLFSGGIKFSLSLFYITQLLFWIGAIAGGIIFQNLFWFILIGIRFLIVGLSIGKATFKLGEKDLFYLFPFLEISNIITQLFIFIGNIFSKPKN